MSWSAFFDASGVAGLMALIWQSFDKWSAFRGRPQLSIRPFDSQRDLRVWDLGNGVRRKVFTLEVGHAGSRAAVRCVATLEITKIPSSVSLSQRHFGLHWAAVPYDMSSTGAQPVNIGSEGHRLDVAFSDERSDGGSWVATPMALLAPGMHQAFLPPGRYEAVVRIGCDGGKGTLLAVQIVSCANWLDFTAKV
jgi:hypothetical protein